MTISIKSNNMANNLTVNNIHDYNIDISNREIYLHPYIDGADEDPCVDFRCAISLEKNLRFLDTQCLDPIIIHMHLPGGYWEDAMGMYDAIKHCRSRVAILAYGQVESASSIIFQAAALRILMPNTYVLIHYGTFGAPASDHPRTAINSVEWNQKESDKMINIFTDKCLDSPIAKDKKWKKMIIKKHIISQLTNKGDWILSAEEAVYYGFADGVLGSRQYPNIDYLKTKVKR
jgi:ATP-dependent protease ClpP protease subunit